MITLTLLLLGAALALAIAFQWRQPAPVVAIAVGVLLALVGAPLDGPLVQEGLLMAATFLVFAVGAEVDRGALRPVLRGAGTLWLANLLVVGTAALAAVLLDLVEVRTAGYGVLVLGGGATLFAFGLLRKRERFFEPTGRLVAAASVLQDASVVIGLALWLAIDEGWAAVGTTALVLGLLAALAWLVASYLAPRFFVRGSLDEEERLLFLVAVLFGFSTLAQWAGLPLVVGAWFAGVAISRFPVGDIARSHLKSFEDFFATLFYVMLGALVASSLSWASAGAALAVVVLLVLRVLVLLPLVRRTKMMVRASIETVLLMAPVGELAVVAVLVGVSNDDLHPVALSTVAMIAAVTMMVIPWLSDDRVTWWWTHRVATRVAKHLPKSLAGHIVLLGCGESGQQVLDQLVTQGHTVVVVDDDPAIVERLCASGILAVRADGAHQDVVLRTRMAHASAVVSTMRRVRDTMRVLAEVSGPRVVVRVFSQAEAKIVSDAGGLPIVEASIAAKALLACVESTVKPDVAGTPAHA